MGNERAFSLFNRWPTSWCIHTPAQSSAPLLLAAMAEDTNFPMTRILLSAGTESLRLADALPAAADEADGREDADVGCTEERVGGSIKTKTNEVNRTERLRWEGISPNVSGGGAWLKNSSRI